MSHAEGHRADDGPRPIRPKQGPLAATDLSGTAIEGEPHRHTLLTRYRSPRTTKTRAEGDTLVVPSLARLGRSLHDLVRLVAGFHDRQVGFHAVADGIDTRSRNGYLVIPLFSALAGLAGLARELGTSRSTIYRVLPALTGRQP